MHPAIKSPTCVSIKVERSRSGPAGEGRVRAGYLTGLIEWHYTTFETDFRGQVNISFVIIQQHSVDGSTSRRQQQPTIPKALALRSVTTGEGAEWGAAEDILRSTRVDE